MTMDISSLYSIDRLLGSTYGTNAAASTNKSSTSFENYLLNALGANNANSTSSSVSSLFNLYANGGTKALLGGLTSSDAASPLASQLLSSLQISGKTDSSLMNWNNPVSTTDQYADYLTKSVQSQMLTNMSAAKSKLQSSFDSFVERMGENPTAAARGRMEQMKQNISVIENYIASKSANNMDALIGQQTGSAQVDATAKKQSLVDQLNAKSAVTQYMLDL